MDAILKERRARQQLAAKPFGVNPRFPRVWPSTVRAAGTELDLAQLPVNAADFQEMQDPITGQLYFVVGISAVDGDDIIL